MTASDDAPASSNPAADEPSSVMYPYLELLSRLQAISSTVVRNDSADDNGDKIEEDPADLTNTASKDKKPQQQQSSRRQHETEWDLSKDALLATLLHELSSHIQSRTHHVSSKIRTLQNSVNQVGVEVGLVQQQWMKKSHDICMEQVVGEYDDEHDTESEEGEGSDVRNKQVYDDDEKDDDDDSSADIARLEAEEKAAIQNGMKALSYFFDPKRKSNKQPVINDNDKGKNEDSNISDESDHHDNIIISTEEDNMIGDNCYFYPAADADVFNQRPLPFIVGSREFMESSCCVGVEEED